MSYEHAVSPTSLRELSVSLSLQPKVVGAEEVREVKIDQAILLQILAQSNPDGLEPKDPILTDANANSQETAAYLAADQNTSSAIAPARTGLTPSTSL